jgi:bacteriocin-like protein
MSDEKAPKPVPELSENQLNQVVGGDKATFLKIEGIPGESTDDKHKDWIELLPVDQVVQK